MMQSTLVKTAGPASQLFSAAINAMKGGTKWNEAFKPFVGHLASFAPGVESAGVKAITSTANELRHTPNLQVFGRNAGGSLPKLMIEGGPKTNFLKQELGTLARSTETFMQNPSLKGFGDIFKNQLKNSQMYTKQVEISPGKFNTYFHERSAIGKVVMPVATTGVGIGGVTAMTAKNPDGTPASIGKKLLEGGKDAIKWGPMAPISGMISLGEGATTLTKKLV